MNTSVNEKSKDIFFRFCEKLGKVDLGMALAVTATIGCAVAMYGIGLEAHGQTELIQSGGQAALDTYQATMHQLSALADVREAQTGFLHEAGRYMANSFAGKNESFGGNAQGIGLALMTVAPAITAATVLLARGFGKVKEFLTGKAEQLMKAQSRQRENDQVTPLARTFGGNSLVMAGIGANNNAPVRVINELLTRDGNVLYGAVHDGGGELDESENTIKQHGDPRIASIKNMQVNHPVSIMKTLQGGSQVMTDITVNKESRPSFFSEERLQEIYQEGAPSCMRPA